MTDIETRVVKVMIAPKDERIFSEMATFVEIDDEAAGEFVKVSQPLTHTASEFAIFIEKETWPHIRDAIDKMIAKCRD